MARLGGVLALFYLLLGANGLPALAFPLSVGDYPEHAQVREIGNDSSRIAFESPSGKGSSLQKREGRRITGQSRGDMGTAEMRERMRDLIPPKELPFYKEKSFLVVMTAALVLIFVWIIKRWGIRPWAALRKQLPFVNEAILVVDLCESTRLAVTQGDAFAMRIKNKMKECVRGVSESFNAKFLHSTGDGYMIAFSGATDAVRAAIKILQNADEYNKDVSEKEKIELRLGISYGELVLDEQGGRHGTAINKAFRIESLTREHQESLGEGLQPEAFPDRNRIFVSEELKEEIKNAHGIGVELVGVFNLKGFTALHRVYQIPWRDLTEN
ncbi:MAG: hypothetical protein GTN81_08515 [Proteobacteria bacterium]|nr:hypothetical protein [Pseudomonadota bacterium]